MTKEDLERKVAILQKAMVEARRIDHHWKCYSIIESTHEPCGCKEKVQDILEAADDSLWHQGLEK